MGSHRCRVVVRRVGLCPVVHRLENKTVETQMNETEWFDGHGVGEEAMERCYWRRLAVLTICAALGLYGLFGAARLAFAEPVARAVVNNGQVVITVHSEDRALTAVVTNLPKRATWVEGGKTFEGCVGVSPIGVAMFYFLADKSVAAVPLEMFQPVTGA